MANFYHPDRGYWEAIGEPSQKVLDSYPEGTIITPPRPSAYHEWQDGGWAEGVVPPAFPNYAKAAAAVVAHINSAIDTVRSQYPVAVQMNWADEEAMAAAYLSETESADQLAALTADASAKGRTPAGHAARILENAQAFRAMAAQARTLWLATDAQLSGVSDPHGFKAIVDAAKAQATALLSA